MEIWKPIEGFEGIYEVSNSGRVRSLDRMRPTKYGSFPIKGCIIKQRLGGGRTQNKYPTVTITRAKPTIKVDRLVHRLVAIAFIPNPENKPEVNHKDGNKLNNNSGNLEWCTRKENVKHSAQSGLLMTNGSHFNAKTKLETIIKIKKQLAHGVKQCVIAREHCLNPRIIQSISSGRTWKHVSI